MFCSRFSPCLSSQGLLPPGNAFARGPPTKNNLLRTPFRGATMSPHTPSFAFSLPPSHSFEYYFSFLFYNEPPHAIPSPQNRIQHLFHSSAPISPRGFTSPLKSSPPLQGFSPLRHLLPTPPPFFSLSDSWRVCLVKSYPSRPTPLQPFVPCRPLRS